ncbi:hypothetical protein AALO_G00152470 [Alosa alosa]|uniref:Uncharacterized protein n=1 Tax=Alosa alosa TaxID=278164 RepID=A0AAV6GEQ5_9TELE|nr:hypothetical protein AALO_G00152470 [Alosa alosa]
MHSAWLFGIVVKLQVSPAGCPQQRPVWRHSFLFLGRDCATVFTPGAALVLELYPTTTVMNSVSWHLRSPVGFCMLFLDQGLYRKLMSERGHRGFRVPQLPLQGSHLQTTTGSTPSVSIVLRLIGSEASDQTMKSNLQNSILFLCFPSTAPYVCLYAFNGDLGSEWVCSSCGSSSAFNTLPFNFRGQG